jgi:hypothetical protein
MSLLQVKNTGSLISSEEIKTKKIVEQPVVYEFIPNLYQSIFNRFIGYDSSYFSKHKLSTTSLFYYNFYKFLSLFESTLYILIGFFFVARIIIFHFSFEKRKDLIRYSKGEGNLNLVSFLNHISGLNLKGFLNYLRTLFNNTSRKVYQYLNTKTPGLLKISSYAEQIFKVLEKYSFLLPFKIVGYCFSFIVQSYLKLLIGPSFLNGNIIDYSIIALFGEKKILTESLVIGWVRMLINILSVIYVYYILYEIINLFFIKTITLNRKKAKVSRVGNIFFNQTYYTGVGTNLIVSSFLGLYYCGSYSKDFFITNYFDGFEREAHLEKVSGLDIPLKMTNSPFMSFDKVFGLQSTILYPTNLFIARKEGGIIDYYLKYSASHYISKAIKLVVEKNLGVTIIQEEMLGGTKIDLKTFFTNGQYPELSHKKIFSSILLLDYLKEHQGISERELFELISYSKLDNSEKGDCNFSVYYRICEEKEENCFNRSYSNHQIHYKCIQNNISLGRSSVQIDANINLIKNYLEYRSYMKSGLAGTFTILESVPFLSSRFPFLLENKGNYSSIKLTIYNILFCIFFSFIHLFFLTSKILRANFFYLYLFFYLLGFFLKSIKNIVRFITLIVTKRIKIEQNSIVRDNKDYVKKYAFFKYLTNCFDKNNYLEYSRSPLFLLLDISVSIFDSDYLSKKKNEDISVKLLKEEGISLTKLKGKPLPDIRVCYDIVEQTRLTTNNPYDMIIPRIFFTIYLGWLMLS